MTRIAVFHYVLLPCALGCPAVGAAAPGASAVILFEAGRPSDGQHAVLINRGDCLVEDRNGRPVLAIRDGTDPYREASWDFRFTDAILADRQSFTLEVVFQDEGAGIIAPSLLADPAFNGTWAAPMRQGSWTRLNTATRRSAYFQFEVCPLDWALADKPHLRITGLQYLESLKLHDSLSEDRWKQIRDSVPSAVAPMVRLARPMQIVCSAGVPARAGFDSLQASLDALHELAPLAKVLGFNAIESYVQWNLVEPEKGRFDFSYYDAIVEKIRSHDLRWFPLLIVGSAYSLPDWFSDSDENVGFVCLEHGLENPIQSIWSPYHKDHVRRFLAAFGGHYEPMRILQGVRLGPSGNYGESQYPAGGNWGRKGRAMHIHIGYWAGDSYARGAFRQWLQDKYADIAKLNRAWGTTCASFAEIDPVLPDLCRSRQHRLDMTTWYTDAMTRWCDWWAVEARKAMPQTLIYQSAGGWGFHESGTDFVGQTKSMLKINGGIRLTNETDSFHQDFGVTRLAATAARLYGVDLGFEPASSHTARGTVARIFNTTTTNGDHFFTYHPNVLGQQMSLAKWLENYHYFDCRQDPVIDVAVYYPETMNRLEEGAFGHLYAWGFYPRAREIRRHIEVDFLDETLIREGFLDRYKVLVFCWGNLIEGDVLATIDRWLRAGGTIVYPSFPKEDLETIEGNRTVFAKWVRGDAGRGTFRRYRGDMEPPSAYGDFVASMLREAPDLHSWTRAALQVQHPENVLFSIQKDGHLLAINFDDRPARIVLADRLDETIAPYSLARFPLTTITPSTNPSP